MLTRLIDWARRCQWVRDRLELYGAVEPPIARVWQSKWNVERRMRQLARFTIDPMEL